MIIFAVFDHAANYWLPPCHGDTEASFLRAMKDSLKGSSSPLANHPGDYSLFEIGSFDDDNGSLVGCEPRKICSVAHLMEDA